MAGQKGKQSAAQSETPFVVVVTNTTLTQVIVGPFATKRKANDYKNTLLSKHDMLMVVTARIMPTKVLDEYLGN